MSQANDTRKFIYRVVRFSLLPIIGVVLLFVAPADKKYHFSYTHNNCLGQGTWIYNRLYEDSTPIDVAFVGSSHMTCAINDSLLERYFTDKGRTVHPANIGYCRLGRNLHAAFINQLYSRKRPKFIVLEVSEKENKIGHPEFGYFAETGDIFNPVWLLNHKLFVDIFDALYVRYNRYREKLSCTYNSITPPAKQYGYIGSPEEANLDLLKLRKDKNTTEWKRASGFSRWLDNQYPFTYIERIHDVVTLNESELVFLYLPTYGTIPEPEEYRFYETNGILLIPPPEILNNPAHWKDVDHMNDKGAQELTYWLCRKLLIIDSSGGLDVTATL